MTPLQRERSSQQKKRAVLILGAVSMLLCYFAYKASIVGRAPGMLQDELKGAAQDGLPLTADDLRRQIAVPPDQNGAEAMKAAFAKYQDWAKKDGHWFGQASRHVADMSDADALKDEAGLATAKPVIDQIRYAVTFPKLVFDRDWDKGYDVMFPEFADANDCRQLLYLIFRVQEAKGDTQAALDTLDTLAKMSGLMSQDPTVIGMIAGSVVQATACDGIGAVLRGRGSDKTVLNRCKSILAELEPKANFRSVLSSEFLIVMASSRLIGTPSGDQMFGEGENVGKIGRFGPAKDLYVLRYVQTMRSVYGAVKSSGGNLIKLRKALDDLDSQPRDWTYGLVNVMGGAYSGFVTSMATEQARVDVLASAIGLLEAKADTGSFPSKLPGSTGKWLDPFTGKPLAYKPSKGGFLIYSFGPDGKDDGGKSRGKGAIADGYDLPFSYP